MAQSLMAQPKDAFFCVQVQGLAATNLTSSVVPSFPPGLTTTLQQATSIVGRLRAGAVLWYCCSCIMIQRDDACLYVQDQGPAATYPTNSSTPSTACRAEGARAGGRIGSAPQQPSSAALASDTLHVSATAPIPPGAEVGCLSARAGLAQATCTGVDGAVPYCATCTCTSVCRPSDQPSPTPQVAPLRSPLATLGAPKRVMIPTA